MIVTVYNRLYWLIAWILVNGGRMLFLDVKMGCNQCGGTIPVDYKFMVAHTRMHLEEERDER